MKITGLITEYNPFHNGHAYHLQKAREVSGADAIVAVMSGDFVQRGESAVIDKYARARMALAAGVDAVVELPVAFATASAEGFAFGAVSLLAGLGVTDIVYGSEAEESENAYLKELASILVNEPAEYKAALATALKAGKNFPTARRMAVDAVAPQLSSLLDSPNNILGIEYEKAALRLSAQGFELPRLHNIKRIGDGHLKTGSDLRAALYGNQQLVPNFTITEATQLPREFAIESPNMDTIQLHQELATQPTNLESTQALSKLGHTSSDIITAQALRELVPQSTIDNLTYTIKLDDFSELLLYRLSISSAEQLSEYADVSPDIANRIIATYKNARTFSELVTLVAARNFTESRIRRALLHILLEMKKTTAQAVSTCQVTLTSQATPNQPMPLASVAPNQVASDQPMSLASAAPNQAAPDQPVPLASVAPNQVALDQPMPPFARILGFREGSNVMKYLKESAHLPIVTKLADAPSDWATDQRASEIYNRVVLARHGITIPDDYRAKLTILP